MVLADRWEAQMAADRSARAPRADRRAESVGFAQECWWSAVRRHCPRFGAGENGDVRGPFCWATICEWVRPSGDLHVYRLDLGLTGVGYELVEMLIAAWRARISTKKPAQMARSSSGERNGRGRVAACVMWNG